MHDDALYYNKLERKELPREVPMRMAVGVASPRAQGQETTCKIN
jgi:hypothetical protein